MMEKLIHTAAGKLEIVRVGLDELDRIMILLQEASYWLLSRGIRQWRRMFTAEGGWEPGDCPSREGPGVVSALAVVCRYIGTVPR